MDTPETYEALLALFEASTPTASKKTATTIETMDFAGAVAPALRAVRHDNMRLLSWIHQHGGGWSAAIPKQAARHGSLACLMYAHAYGCPWREFATIRAAMIAGSLPCFLFAVEHAQQSFAASLLHLAIEQGNVRWMDYLWKKSNRFQRFRAKPEFAETLTELAAQHGHLDCLTYLHERGVKWDATTTIVAAENGQLACLAYAHEHGCRWTKAAATVAHHEGHEDCLTYLLRHGCPLDSPLQHLRSWKRRTAGRTRTGTETECLGCRANKVASDVDAQTLPCMEGYGCPTGACVPAPRKECILDDWIVVLFVRQFDNVLDDDLGTEQIVFVWDPIARGKS